jgi:hypothetical protein
MRRGAIAGLLGALLSWTATAAPAPAQPPVADAREARRIEAVIVVTADIDDAAMIDALALRAPERAIQPAGRARPAVKLFVVAEVRMKDAHTVALAVIASDFRAWYRTVEATPEDAPRVAASALANLLAGIEEDREVPDAQDVPLPEGATAEPARAPGPAPAKVEPATVAPAAAKPRPEILVELSGAPVVAIPPPRPSGIAAAGGEIGVGVRGPKLLFGALSLRAAGRTAGDLGLVRVRVSVQVGIALRRRSFELVATAGPDIEPIVARRGGAREDFRFPDGTTRATALLLGGHLRVSPGYRHVWKSGAALRIGPRVELGGAGLESGGVARLFTEGDDPLLRAGGLELSAGLELGGWFPIGR